MSLTSHHQMMRPCCFRGVRPLMSSYSLSILEELHDDDTSMIATKDERKGSSRMALSSSSKRRHRTQTRGRYYHEKNISQDSFSAELEDNHPLSVPLPSRRPFRFPVRQSSSGKHLTLRPLAKPRFHARFGKRPMPAMLFADELGLEVPRELRAEALVQRPSSLDHQTMLSSFITRQSEATPTEGL